MPTRKPLKPSHRRKIAKALRAYHAKVRRIAESEGISYTEARQIEKRSFIYTIRRTDERYSARFFQIEDEPGKRYWKKLKPGKPAKRQFVTGKKLTFGEVMRSYGVGVYHSLVRHIAAIFDMPLSRARRMFTDFKEAMKDAARSVGKPASKFRARDVAAVIEYSDRYPAVRLRYGI